MKNALTVFIAAFILISAVPCRAEVIYVDSTASGANNGSSWADAYRHMQDALAGAAYGDEMWAAEGVYKPDRDAAHPVGTGRRLASFALVNGVALYGGFAAGGGDFDDRDPNMYECTLSGDLNGDDVVLTEDDNPITDPSRSDNSNHVVIGSYTDPNTILDGFTITAGLAGPDGWDPNDDGGGMYIYAGEPSISNCNFTGNYAAGGGGGICIESAELDISDCSFIGNYARYGGAIYGRYPNGITATRCNFTGNHASVYGGAIYNRRSSRDIDRPYGSLIATDCTFVDNTADLNGGGVYYDHVELTDCTFKGNLAGDGGAGWDGSYGGYGGGVYTKSAILADCVFVANSAGNGGGMLLYNRPDDNPGIVRTMELTNCTFRDNQAWGTGGGLGIYTKKNYQVVIPTVLTDCVFIRNSTNPASTYSSGGGAVLHAGATLTNCIFTENSAEGIYSTSSGGLDASNATLTNCVFTRNSITAISVANNSKSHCEGGAMRTSNSTLIDCTFRENFATVVRDGMDNVANGGAVHSHGNTTMTGCTFTDNWVKGGGGAICNDQLYEIARPIVTNCSFVGNSAYGAYGAEGHGGAIFNERSHATITDCEFTENLAENEGGAIHNNYCEPVITNCSFTENSVIGYRVFGGAIGDISCDTVITGCEFIGNTAVGDIARGGATCDVDTMRDCIFTGNSTIGRLSYGGAIWQSYRGQGNINCLFSGNYAKGELARGGAIYNNGGKAMTNCTFVGNSAHGTTEGYGGGIYAVGQREIKSCILVDNTDDTGAGQSAQFYHDYPPQNFYYSCIQGWDGQWGGVGNIGDSPLFVDSGYWDPNETPDDVSDDTWIEGDYHLRAASPCVDTGDPDFPPHIETDLGGNARVVNGRIDMGVYEYFDRPPVADAGEDQAVSCGISGSAAVILDGSGSYDPDGEELSYLWTWAVGGELFDANGVSPTIELPAGEHVIDLVVNDGSLDSEPNAVIVTVIAPVEAKMIFVPRVINIGSRGRFVMALMYLPEGIGKHDIVDGSVALYINGNGSSAIVPHLVRVVGSGNRQRVFVVFDRAEVVAALSGESGAVHVGIAAELTDGRSLYGSDTIRMVRPSIRQPRSTSRSSRSKAPSGRRSR
ncbi:MAG: right-handed parallel beta-helix repeat-containing protein [Planctomycetes bacterium]|nr:right-handed parallel beta-helix repeat-containing protein [Planctomycetota bacterium]